MEWLGLVLLMVGSSNPWPVLVVRKGFLVVGWLGISVVGSSNPWPFSVVRMGFSVGISVSVGSVMVSVSVSVSVLVSASVLVSVGLTVGISTVGFLGISVDGSFNPWLSSVVRMSFSVVG